MILLDGSVNDAQEMCHSRRLKLGSTLGGGEGRPRQRQRHQPAADEFGSRQYLNECWLCVLVLLNPSGAIIIMTTVE